METNALRKKNEKKPKMVFEVVENYCYNYEMTTETVLCASILDARFEFKEMVERVKKEEEQCFDEEGNVKDGYVCEDDDDYFDLYRDGDSARFGIAIRIKEREVISHF